MEITAKYLLARLKKAWAPAATIVENDIIIVSDDNFWLVSEVRRKENGFYTIVSEQGEGFLEVPPSHVFMIVNRGCFGK